MAGAELPCSTGGPIARRQRRRPARVAATAGLPAPPPIPLAARARRASSSSRRCSRRSALIVIQAAQAGWGQVWPALDRAFVATLLWNTVRLAIVVTVLSAVHRHRRGVADRAHRAARAAGVGVLLIVPIVIPDFVLAWTWSSIFPVGPGLLRCGPGDDAAPLPARLPADGRRLPGGGPRSGRGRPQPRPVAVGGLAADQRPPGPVHAARRLPARLPVAARPTTAPSRTCATRRSPPRSSASCRRSSIRPARRRSRWCSSPCHCSSSAGRRSSGARPPAALGPDGPARPDSRSRCGSDPARSPSPGSPYWSGSRWDSRSPIVCYWMVAGVSSSSARRGRRWQRRPGTPRSTAPSGALVATVLALPVSLLAARHQRRWSTALERSTFIIQAIPGVVIGLALVYRGQPVPGLPLPEPGTARRRLRAHVLPARPGRHDVLGRPRVAAARGGGPVPGQGAAGRCG